MKKLIIFGLTEAAELAHFYFVNDTQYEPAAFTVDEKYIDRNNFCELPVIPFEDIETVCPPDECVAFIAMGYSKLNVNRSLKYQDFKNKGYEICSYISSKATIWPGFQCGENCFILEDNTIQPFVKIANNVTLWSGNHIGHHSEIRDNCFITSHVVISGGVIVKENTFIGVNSTIRDHVVIERNNVIAAGATILKDTIENSVYMGTPAVLSKVPSNRLRGI